MFSNSPPPRPHLGTGTNGLVPLDRMLQILEPMLGDADRFLEAVPVPVLMFEVPGAPEPAPNETGETPEKPTAPITAETVLLGGYQGQIGPLQPRYGNSQLQQLVAVGRARNCDLVVRLSSISKLHAVFIGRDEGWFVRDLGSTNGTKLRGEHLPPDEERPIDDGDGLTFGPEVLARFIRPHSLRAILRGHLRGAQAAPTLAPGTPAG